MIKRAGLFLSQAKRYLWVSMLFKFKLSDKIRVPNIAFPIFLRPGSSDVPTFNQIFTFKEYEFNPGFVPKNIIDAGANIGLAAIYFTNKYPDAKIFSIEPEQSNFAMIEKNIKNYKNIIPYKRAISNVGDVTLNVVDDGMGNWGFMTKENGIPETGKIIDSVKTITISDIMRENNLQSIDLLKIDIEGAEKELFSDNYESWLPKTKCLIIELHDFMKEGTSTSFFRAISKYEFSYRHKGENLIFINKDKSL